MRTIAENIISQISRAERRYILAGDRSVTEWLVDRLAADLTPTQAEAVVEYIEDQIKREEK